MGAFAFFRSPFVLSAYSFIIGFIMAILAAPNQGISPSRLDELAKAQEHNGHYGFSSLLFKLSAAMHSPVAEMHLARELTQEGRIQDAWDYYFDAVFRFPSLGLEAGRNTLKYAVDDDDYGVASTYLTRAAILAGNSEAKRLLGDLILGRESVSCERWLNALDYFQQAASGGDPYAQLIVAAASLAEIGTPRDYQQFLVNILAAQKGKNGQIATIARKVIGELPYAVPFEPDEATQIWDPYPSTLEAKRMLIHALTLDNPITVPDVNLICRSQMGCCDPSRITIE